MTILEEAVKEVWTKVYGEAQQAEHEEYIVTVSTPHINEILTKVLAMPIEQMPLLINDKGILGVCATIRLRHGI